MNIKILNILEMKIFFSNRSCEWCSVVARRRRRKAEEEGHSWSASVVPWVTPLPD